MKETFQFSSIRCWLNQSIFPRRLDAVHCIDADNTNKFNDSTAHGGVSNQNFWSNASSPSSIRLSYVALLGNKTFHPFLKQERMKFWKYDLFMKLIYFSHYFIFVFIPCSIIIIVTFVSDVTRNKPERWNQKFCFDFPNFMKV